MPDGTSIAIHHSLPGAARALPPPLRLLFRLVASGLPETLAAWVFARMLRPARRRKSRAASASGQMQTIHSDAGPLQAYRWGDHGPLALLVHGWEGSADDLSAFVEPLRRSGFRVLALDLPAHGLSSGTQTDVHQMADALAHCLREQGPAAVVVAHSLGAAVAARCRQRDPGLIRRLALIAPGGELQDEIDHVAQLLSLPQRCKHALSRVAAAHYGCAVSECSTRVALAAVPTTATEPILLVHDHADTVVPYAASERLVQALPHCERMTTLGLGHRRILSDPAVIARVVEYCVPSL